MKEKVNVTGVPETMVQTLYARAKETKKQNAKIRDEIAVELAEKLDYDFSKADKDKAMSCGVIARTIVLDRMVRQYLEKHENTVVVNIACGLDTRCYRMKEKSIEGSNAKFTWGVKNGTELQKIVPNYSILQEVSLVEGMKELMPVYCVIVKIPAVRNISNKIIIVEKRG